MEPLSCLSSHLPLAAALLLGLTFLRCIGADWNSTAKNELKEALCAEAEENCTDSLEPEKGSHFSRCAKEYEHYCVKGKCRYVVEMKKPSCVCQHGYIGSRCELLDLYYLRGDRGQLVVIGLIAGLVAIVILIICTCACSHHCRRRRKEKKKEEHVETLNRDDSNTGDASESPVAPSWQNLQIFEDPSHLAVRSSRGNLSDLNKKEKPSYTMCVSVVDEANQTVSLHDECRSLTERGPEHLVD